MANSRKVVSARGEIVDFDLLKIKAQINDSPKSVDVVARERFIDKRRRRTNRKTNEMLSQQAESKRYAEEAIKLQQEQKAAQQSQETPVIEVVAIEEPKAEEAKVEPKNKFERKLNK